MGPSSTRELNSGSEMPVIGLGTWQMGHRAVEAISNGIRRGYRMIDTSGDYGTQAAVGEALRVTEIGRDKIFIVTKIEENEDAYDATLANVQEMGLAYADLILIHRPPHDSAGQELWQGLIRARQDRIARDIGVSNYSIDQLQELIDDSGIVPAVNQIEWTPFGHSVEMLEFCKDNDIVIQAYSPLTREEKADDQRLARIAETYGKTPEQIMLRWNLQLGTVPLPKASNFAHQRENLDIFDFILSEDDMETLNSMNQRYSSLSSLQYI